MEQQGETPGRRMPSGVSWHRVLSVGGAFVGIVAIGWVLWRLDYDRLGQVISEANLGFLLLVPLSITAEQLISGWKWRQLLYAIRPVGTFRLFGAIMAGYFVNTVVPLGISPLVRSWLVARLESLKMSTVLATTAISRLVDGVVFTGFVAVALIFTAFPEGRDNIRVGLVVAGVGSLALFVLLWFALARYRRAADNSNSGLMRLADRLPVRFATRGKRALASFAKGIVWPRKTRRAVGVVLASFAMKLIATTQLLWAGLAFGVVLRPAEYVFLVVFLGFIIIISRIARIPGGYFVGTIFALGLFGVAEEQAVAIVLVAQASTILAVSVVGVIALWKNGITIADLRTAGQEA